MADVDVVSVRVKPNTSTFRSELRSQLSKIDHDFKVKIVPDLDKVAVTRVEEKIAAVTKDRNVAIDLRVNKLDQIQAVARDVQNGLSRVTKSGRELIGVTSSVLANVGRLAVGFAALTVGAGIFSQLVLSAGALVAGLVAVSQAAVALPGIFAGLALSIVTIKLGADGIKKAFEALKPTMAALKTQVSGVFQRELTPAVTALRSLIPQLTNGFKSLASSIASAGKSFTDAFKNQGGVAATNQLLAAMSKVARDLASAFGPFAVALLNIAKIGASALAPLTSGLKDAAQRFADFTKSAVGVSKIEGSIRTGIDALRQLGSVAKDIGGIFSGVFKAMKAGSGDAFGGLKTLTSGMRDFVQSAQGQEVLTSFFSSLRGIITAVTPLIKTLADIIGRTLAPVIANIATALGPALNRVFQGIGEALQAASPGIIALANGFADFIDGIRPALPVIGEVASQLGSALGDALRNLAPPFLQLIQDLAPSLPSVAEAVGKLAVAGLKLLDALSPLLGPIAQIAGLLADQLVPVFETLKPMIEPIATALGTALLDAMKQLAPVLPPLVQAFSQIVLALANGLMPILPGLVGLIGPVAQSFILLTPVVLGLAIPFIAATGAAVALAQALSGDVKGALQTTKQTIQTTGALTKQIIDTDWAGMAASVSDRAGEISNSVKNMGTRIQSDMEEGVFGASSVLRDGVGGWAGTVAAGTEAATGALGTGVAPWEGLVGGAMNGANNAMNGGMEDLVGEASRGVGNATGEIGKLPPNISGQLAGTEQQMRNIGNAMMQGLANGIAVAGRFAIAAAQAIAAQVVAIMSSVLRINSPSKVIRDKIGVAIPEGLAAGIEKGSPLALSAASGLANDVVTASSAAVEGLSPTFRAALAVTPDTTTPIQVAADSAFDRVTAALEGWAVVLDPRGVASLSRTGAVLNGVR